MVYILKTDIVIVLLYLNISLSKKQDISANDLYKNDLNEFN